MWIRLPGSYGLLSLVGITEPSGVCLPAKELGQHLSQRKNLILVGREDSEEEPDGGSYWSPEFCVPKCVPMGKEWQASRTEVFLFQHLGHEFTILRIRPVLNDKMPRQGFVVGCYLVDGGIMALF